MTLSAIENIQVKQSYTVVTPLASEGGADALKRSLLDEIDQETPSPTLLFFVDDEQKISLMPVSSNPTSSSDKLRLLVIDKEGEITKEKFKNEQSHTVSPDTFKFAVFYEKNDRKTGLKKALKTFCKDELNETHRSESGIKHRVRMVESLQKWTKENTQFHTLNLLSLSDDPSNRKRVCLHFIKESSGKNFTTSTLYRDGLRAEDKEECFLKATFLLSPWDEYESAFIKKGIQASVITIVGYSLFFVGTKFFLPTYYYWPLIVGWIAAYPLVVIPTIITISSLLAVGLFLHSIHSIKASKLSHLTPANPEKKPPRSPSMASDTKISIGGDEDSGLGVPGTGSSLGENASLSGGSIKNDQETNMTESADSVHGPDVGKEVGINNQQKTQEGGGDSNHSDPSDNNELGDQSDNRVQRTHYIP